MVTDSIIVLNDPKSPAAEAYRMVRTNLDYTNIDHDNKVMIVTSSKTQEGKTTTICNLAATLSQDGKKVLLVDCDLRKPRIHKLFNLSNQIGLTNILTNQNTLEEGIQQIEELPKLFIMPSGPIPPMPSELLGSKRMCQLLEDIAKDYDYVLIDTPPVLSVTDASIIAGKVDGVILTVAMGETHKDAIRTAVKSLERVEANMLGVILTKADVNKKGYYYYYDYGYQHEEKEKKKWWGKREKKAVE